jgi:hypothetical protein
VIDAAVSRTMEAVERRADDVRGVFLHPGAEPNYADVRDAGRVEPLRDPLAVVPPQGTYLLAGDPRRPYFLRDGALQVHDGTLTASDGVTPVLGFSVNGEAAGLPHPLRLEERDALLDRAFEVRVESDGLLSYSRRVVDAVTLESHAERVSAGRVALARFPPGTQLERVDALRTRAPAGVVPLVGTPADGTFGALATWSRWGGGIDADRAIERLADGYLMMRALGATERTRNAMARGAFELVK